MQIEELSKAQLILLTILVNFVMSVATSIMTVSLLDQASPVVTQAISRVVDRTVERVVQAVPAVAPLSPAPSNQDLVINAIAANAHRSIAFYPPRTGTSSPAYAVGTWLPKSRVAVTIANEFLLKDMLIQFADGKTALATRLQSKDGIVLYRISDTVQTPEVPATGLVAERDLRIGQTVLAITSDGSAATGIVSKVTSAGVLTTLPDLGGGSAVVDINGNIAGIASAVPGTLYGTGLLNQMLSATSTSH